VGDYPPVLKVGTYPPAPPWSDAYDVIDMQWYRDAHSLRLNDDIRRATGETRPRCGRAYERPDSFSHIVRRIETYTHRRT